jgi:ATP-dependent RNA helicase DDX24/MAK5
LEAFKESPVGILVATDVAARGLDVERISSVIHYDIARSAQVYIHRSGRTARANQSGSSVSLVSPEDSFHHTTICQAIGLMPSMTQYAVESGAISILRERVTLAKKIFTESFVQSQTRKDDAWFEQQSNAADLLGDDFQISGSRGDSNIAKMSKKQLDKARNNLKKMVETPVELAKDGIGSRKKGFVVINPFLK